MIYDLVIILTLLPTILRTEQLVYISNYSL